MCLFFCLAVQIESSRPAAGRGWTADLLWSRSGRSAPTIPTLMTLLSFSGNGRDPLPEIWQSKAHWMEPNEKNYWQKDIQGSNFLDVFCYSRFRTSANGASWCHSKCLHLHAAWRPMRSQRWWPARPAWQARHRSASALAAGSEASAACRPAQHIREGRKVYSFPLRRSKML